jgi:hypothetical protein
VRVPDAWTERLPILEALEEDWELVPPAVLIAACAFYAIFLVQLAQGKGLPPLMDLVFIPIHEGGHALFSYFGHTLMIAGGTILQLGVPLLLAAYFLFRRQVQGTAFCAFFFFEQLLPTATYMADARAQQLPLITIGDPELAEHDWFTMFGKLGVLDHDTQIAGFFRFIGWAGMLATVAWMVYRSLSSQPRPEGDSGSASGR